jgi:hypothetical protein
MIWIGDGGCGDRSVEHIEDDFDCVEDPIRWDQFDHSAVMAWRAVLLAERAGLLPVIGHRGTSVAPDMSVDSA